MNLIETCTWLFLSFLLILSAVVFIFWNKNKQAVDHNRMETLNVVKWIEAYKNENGEYPDRATFDAHEKGALIPNLGACQYSYVYYGEKDNLYICYCDGFGPAKACYSLKRKEFISIGESWQRVD